MLHTSERKRYDPTEVIESLGNARSRPSTLVDMMVDQIGPFVPADKWETYGRAHVINGVLGLRYKLRERFKEELRSAGVWDVLEPRLGWGEEKKTDILPTVEEVQHLLDEEESTLSERGIDIEALKEHLRILLNEARDGLTADLIARLGFFEISNEEEEGSPTIDESIPPWFNEMSQGLRDGPLALIQRLADRSRPISRDKQGAIPDLYELQNWQQTTTQQFKACVRDVFHLISSLRKNIVPTEQFPQKIGMGSDLETKSGMELLEIILHPTSELRRRFEALLILWWAVGLFYIRNHPVYKVQHDVHNDIRSLFNHNVWPGIIKYSTTGIGRVDTDDGAIFLHPIPEGEKAKDTDIPRLVHPNVRAILEKGADVIDDTNHITYESRTKTDISLLIKMLLVQERVRECLAVQAGKEVRSVDKEKKVLTEAEAAKFLLEKDRDMREFHDPEADIKLKQGAFELNRDGVGITLALALKKPVEELDDSDKASLRNTLGELTEYLADSLMLEKDSLRIVNNLCPEEADSSGRVRPNRNGKFKEWKILGIRKHTAPNGKIVEVPIEIQIQALEVFALARSPGHEAATHHHQARKASDLARLTAPRKINGVDVYPPFDADSEDLVRAFTEVAQ